MHKDLHEVIENYTNITKPNHYKGNGMEVLNIIDAFELGPYEANIIKYVLRYKKKNGVDDLRKAAFYLLYLIEKHEASAND